MIVIKIGTAPEEWMPDTTPEVARRAAELFRERLLAAFPTIKIDAQVVDGPGGIIHREMETIQAVMIRAWQNDNWEKCLSEAELDKQ